MADNQIVQIDFQFDLGNVPASTKAFSNYLKGLGVDLKFTKASTDALAQSVAQLATAQTQAAQAGASAASTVKKSNQQWTNFALIIQDLPYGFRGIQNNLPAVIGGFAKMTGPLYLAGSAIIALFTAWDAGIIKFGNSVKLTTDFSKEAAAAYSNETIKLESLYRVTTDSTRSMSDRLDAAKELKKEYPGLLGNYSEEEIALGKAKTAYSKLTDTIWKYALAQAATKELEEIASKKLPLMIEKTKLLAKERELAALENNKEALQGINVYSQYNSPLANIRQKIKDNTAEQAALNKKASEYTPIIDANINSEAELAKFKAKPNTSKEDARAKKYLEDKKRTQAEVNKAELDGFLTTLSLQQKEEYETNKKFVDLEAKARAFGLSTIGLEEARQKELNSIKEKYDLKETERSQKSIKDNAEWEMKFLKDSSDAISRMKKDASDAAKKIDDRELQNSLDALKIQSDVETKLLLKGGKSNASSRIKVLEDYKSKLYDLASTGGYTAEQFDKISDAIIRVDAAIAGSKDSVKDFGVSWQETLNGINTVIMDFINNSMFALGDSIGKALAGDNVDIINTFGMLLADALQAIGKQLIALATATLFAWALLSNPNPVTAGLALAAGITAVALGSYLKSTLNKKQTGGGAGGVSKFANGGIISGPTMGLMGEYPGASSNPEVVAPLDKLKDLIGGNGRLEARVSGNDLLILMNKAQRNNNVSF